MNLRVLLGILCFIVVKSLAQEFVNDEGGYTFVNKVRFPFSPFYDPFMGLIIAFDIKLTPSEIDADFAWNIEANYFLPQNESEYSFPPIIPADSAERGLFDRSLLYRMFEMKLESPTSSTNKNLPPKYINAETYGKKNRHCNKYKNKCPIDVLSFFTVLGELLDNKFLE